MSDSVQPHRWQPTRLPRPWDSPGTNSGMGCHFLLQCMRVKSESEVAQSCPTLSYTMDRSLPGSSIHGVFQARVLEWGTIIFSTCFVDFFFFFGEQGPHFIFQSSFYTLSLLSRIFKFYKESDTPEWLFLSQGLYWRKKISISSPRPICHPARITTLQNVHITHKQSLLSIISVWITSCSKLKRVLNIYSQVLPWQSSG